MPSPFQKSAFAGVCTAWCVVVLGVLANLSDTFTTGSSSGPHFEVGFIALAAILGFVLGFIVQQRRNRKRV